MTNQKYPHRLRSNLRGGPALSRDAAFSGGELMEIIDSQIHEPHPERAWEFGGDSQLAVDVELAREAMDSVGVDRVINAGEAFIDAALSRYPERSLRAPDAGGIRPDRLMWGSDFTRMRMAPGTIEPGPRETWATLYSDSVTFVRDTDQLSQSDKEKTLGATLRRIFRWPR
jgi:hypothetical protein